MNKVEKIKALILNNLEGFSVDFTTLKPLKKEKGIYCIALTDNSRKDLVKSIKSVVSASILFHQIKDNLVLGGWYDNKADRYCLDIAIQGENKAQAMMLTKVFNQKAIFNLETFEEIKNEDYNGN